MNILTSRRKFLAVGCNHGTYADDAMTRALFRFKAEWKPDTVIHLGDAFDTTAFRAGAHGTPDEGASVPEDVLAGLAFVNELEPDLWFMGNHEDRVWKLASHPNALVAYCATVVKGMIAEQARELKAELVLYGSIADPNSWRTLGGTAFSHGFMFNENACRDHVEYLGRSCVIAHLHKVQSQPGRVLGHHAGHCVGTLCDIPAMGYAKARRSTASWSAGWAYGEYTDDSCEVILHKVKESPVEIPKASCAAPSE